MVRLGCAVAALTLILAIGPSHFPAEAQTSSGCLDSPPLRLDGATLVLRLDAVHGVAGYELSGRGTLAEDAGPVDDLTPAELCTAALSSDFAVEGRPFCREHVRRPFRVGDELHRDGRAVSFVLSGAMLRPDRKGILSVRLPMTVCAARLELEIRPSPGTDLGISGVLPDRLDAMSATFRLSGRSGMSGRDIVVFTRVHAQGDSPGSDPEEQTADRRRPPSLAERIGHRTWMLERSGRSLLSVVAILLVFLLFSRRTPLPYTRRPFRDVAATPILYAGGLALCQVYLLWDSELRHVWRTLLPHIDGRLFNGPPANYLSYAVLSVPLLALLGTSQALARRPTGAPAFVATAGRTALLGLWFAALGSLVPLITWMTEPFGSVGYEIPGAAVSLLFGVVAVSAVRDLFQLSTARTWLLAFALAGSVFLPAAPVITGIGNDVSASDNAAVWARVVSAQYASLLYVTGLAALAFWLARNARGSNPRLPGWLLLLLLMQVAQFSMTSVASAFAAAVLILSAHRWIFLPDGRDTPVPAAPDDPRPDRRFCWQVGATAAAIFLAQYAFGDGRPGFEALPLLALTQLLFNFATGATAALLLSVAMARLRGGNATIKAFNLGLLLVGTNIAVHLDRLAGISKATGVLTEHMAVVSALVLCTLYRYDLPRIRDADGQVNMRRLFSGTAIAHALPLISAVAAAVASAALPILSNEVGSALADMLRSTLPAATVTSPGR